MTILDYAYLILLAVAFFLGLVKGFLKIAFALVGVVVVSIGASYLSPYADGWLTSVIASDGTRAIVAMVATFLALSIIYGFITKLISKLINKISILGWINRLLGAATGVAIVYLVFALVTSLVFNSAEEGILSNFASLIKEPFSESWIITNIYGGAENPEKNFFGGWLIENFLEKINQIAPAS